MADEYYLQNCSAGYIGDFPVFWHKTNSGYTPYIDDAKVFTKAEADEIIRSTRGSHSWKTWPVKLVRRSLAQVAVIEQMRGWEAAEQRGELLSHVPAARGLQQGATGPVGIPGPLGPIDTGIAGPAGPFDKVAEFKNLGLELVPPVAAALAHGEGWRLQVSTGAYPWKENESPNRVEQMVQQFWLDISRAVAQEVELAAENKRPEFTAVSDLTVVVEDGITWAYVYLR